MWRLLPAMAILPPLLAASYAQAQTDSKAMGCASVYLFLSQSAVNVDPAQSRMLFGKAAAVEQTLNLTVAGADPSATHQRAEAGARDLRMALATGRMSMATIAAAYQTCNQLYPNS